MLFEGQRSRSRGVETFLVVSIRFERILANQQHLQVAVALYGIPISICHIDGRTVQCQQVLLSVIRHLTVAQYVVSVITCYQYTAYRQTVLLNGDFLAISIISQTILHIQRHKLRSEACTIDSKATWISLAGLERQCGRIFIETETVTGNRVRAHQNHLDISDVLAEFESPASSLREVDTVQGQLVQISIE